MQRRDKSATSPGTRHEVRPQCDIGDDLPPTRHEKLLGREGAGCVELER